VTAVGPAQIVANGIFAASTLSRSSRPDSLTMCPRLLPVDPKSGQNALTFSFRSYPTLRRKLDEVSVRSGRSDVAPQSLADSLRGETGLLEIRFTRLNSHSPPGSSYGLPSHAPCLAAYLPPRNEARMLLNHAAHAPDAPLRMLHVPSIQALDSSLDGTDLSGYARWPIS
jgi:hypothetical protein